jgi:DNA-binding beta-propeller fold protein YncE
VTDTIAAKDEPADIVFANNHAFVSISRLNLINVYNASTHALVKTIPVFGGLPKALALSPDGTTVYSAFRASGNQTTSIPYELAGAYQPTGPPQFLPIPLQDYITTYNNPAFSNYIKFTMPDNDVVAINTSTLAINGYFNTVGTSIFNIAVQPSTGTLFVTNTDSTNQVQDQATMCGQFSVNRLSKVTTSNTVVAYVLDPPSSIHCAIDTNALSLALAQPANVVFDGTGNPMYIAAFGTDRIAQVDTSGNILARIDINQSELGATAAPATKRGPRGLAINTSANILYEWNRISNTFSIINTASNKVVAWDLKAGSNDPTPSVISQGRGFLYDAKLSGNGSVSCASCHPDAETDHLAWACERQNEFATCPREQVGKRASPAMP